MPAAMTESITRLFEIPTALGEVSLDLGDEPAVGMTATEVKTALRRRHPGDTVGGMVGQWTCIEEWQAIDLLALNAWSKADVVGYEVKISRSDMRGELLRPSKRARAVAMTTEFYFAVPAGLLVKAEIAWEEPDWQLSDFKRQHCPGVPEFGGMRHHRAHHQRWGGRCVRDRRLRAHVVRVPAPPEVIKVPDWVSLCEGEDETTRARRWIDAHDGHYAEVPCWNCGGKGYLERSRVELEAPTLWVPRDVGLIEVRQSGCRVAKASPKRIDPTPLASSRKHLNDLVRWVSHRPDPRH